MQKILLLLHLFSFTACGQLRQLCFLPQEIEENSGIIAVSTNQLWLHNDGGNPACLYKIDSTGNVLRRLFVTNAPNKDWEDIAIDRERGHVYIGDFGNNDNLRKDLRILKIDNPDNIEKDSTQAQVIEFYYPQQQAFPPNEQDLHYDAEAFIYFRNYLYIFTKCRTKPYTSLTRLYQVPCTEGKHAAVLLDSFDTRQASWYQSVTGAAVSPSGSQVALVSGGKAWIFNQFPDNQFFKGKTQNISLAWFSQKEAIDFINENELFVSDERSFLGRAKLYLLTLKKAPKEENTDDLFRRVQINPIPIKKEFSLDFKLLKPAKVAVHLYDEDRKFLQTIVTESELQSGEQHFDFDIKTLEIERYFSYFLVLESEGRQDWHPIVVR